MSISFLAVWEASLPFCNRTQRLYPILLSSILARSLNDWHAKRLLRPHTVSWPTWVTRSAFRSRYFWPLLLRHEYPNYQQRAKKNGPLLLQMSRNTSFFKTRYTDWMNLEDLHVAILSRLADGTNSIKKSRNGSVGLYRLAWVDRFAICPMAMRIFIKISDTVCWSGHLLFFLAAVVTCFGPEAVNVDSSFSSYLS